MKNITPSTLFKVRFVSAFTIVELLVVVAILGLMLSIAMVNYLRDLNKQNLYRAAGQVESVIKDGRSKAAAGYLGDDLVGYCTGLENITIYSYVVSGRSRLMEILNCADGSGLTISQLILDENYSFDHSFEITYPPFGGASLLQNGLPVEELSFAVLSSSNQVNFNLGRGGDLSISYE